MNGLTQDIHWYPGHMAKAKRKIIESLPNIDMVIELLDSRAPLSSRNPDFKDIFKNLNSDLLCCQLDIAPTLCYLLGLEIPCEHMGQNLLSPDFYPRTIGILNNESIFFQSEKLEFSESLINPATSTIAIKKWINNLLAN